MLIPALLRQIPQMQVPMSLVGGTGFMPQQPPRFGSGYGQAPTGGRGNGGISRGSLEGSGGYGPPMPHHSSNGGGSRSGSFRGPKAEYRDRERDMQDPDYTRRHDQLPSPSAAGPPGPNGFGRMSGGSQGYPAGGGMYPMPYGYGYYPMPYGYYPMSPGAGLMSPTGGAAHGSPSTGGKQDSSGSSSGRASSGQAPLSPGQEPDSGPQQSGPHMASGAPAGAARERPGC